MDTQVMAVKNPFIGLLLSEKVAIVEVRNNDTILQEKNQCSQHWAACIIPMIEENPTSPGAPRLCLGPSKTQWFRPTEIGMS